MNPQLYIAFQIFLFIIILHLTPPVATATAEPPHHHRQPPSPPINSNSVLSALQNSHYTELSKLIEKSLLLQTLKQYVSSHNITIFTPTNSALVRHLDYEFKRFLLEPENLILLKHLFLHHVIPYRTRPDDVGGSARVTRPDDVVRHDGLIHGIDGLLVPRVVEEEYNWRRRRSLISVQGGDGVVVPVEVTAEKTVAEVAPPLQPAEHVAEQIRGKAYWQYSRFTRRLEGVRVQHENKERDSGLFRKVPTQEKGFLLFLLFFTSFVFIICGCCYYE